MASSPESSYHSGGPLAEAILGGVEGSPLCSRMTRTSTAATSSASTTAPPGQGPGVPVRDDRRRVRQAMESTEDATEQRASELSERALLHVSATRAIKGLVVTYYGAPSPFLGSEEVGS